MLDLVVVNVIIGTGMLLFARAHMVRHRARTMPSSATLMLLPLSGVISLVVLLLYVAVRSLPDLLAKGNVHESATGKHPLTNGSFPEQFVPVSKWARVVRSTSAAYE
jgi:hypothetical protein